MAVGRARPRRQPGNALLCRRDPLQEARPCQARLPALATTSLRNAALQMRRRPTSSPSGAPGAERHGGPREAGAGAGAAPPRPPRPGVDLVNDHGRVTLNVVVVVVVVFVVVVVVVVVVEYVAKFWPQDAEDL